MTKSTKTNATTNTAGTGEAPANDNGNGGAPKSPSTALAKPPGDELAALELDDGLLDDDGLAEVGQEDKKLTILMINFGGMGKNGRATPRDTFYNTVTEHTQDVVEAVFISLHKTRVWSKFNESTKRTDVFCRSFDQLAGTMDNGTIRPCTGCPDWVWRTEPDEKTGQPRKTRNCSHVYNVASVERSTQQPFLIRFKKTSLRPFKEHLQKFHLDRRPLGGGKMGNYPLYVFGVKLTAQMASKDAQHAVPVLEHTGILSREEIVAYAATAKELATQIADMIKRADTVEAGAEAGDTSFDTSKFVDASGDDFVAPAEGA